MYSENINEELNLLVHYLSMTGTLVSTFVTSHAMVQVTSSSESNLSPMIAPKYLSAISH